MADDKLTMLLLVVFASFFLPVQALFKPLVGAVICGAGGFDVNNITRSVWTFDAPKEECLHPKTVNGTVPESGCKISMAVCQTGKLPEGCSDAAICESYTGDSSTYKLATTDNDHQPFNTTAPALPGEGFHLSYSPGENYTTADNKTCKLQTVVTFICNSTAVWVSGTAEPHVVPVLPIIKYDPQKCVYNFTFQFAGACPEIVPAPRITSLSAGSVLLLIFFVSTILYFVLGCFVNIARGKTGPEIIPHNTFWAMLPVYIMDGIQFTCSCGRRDAGKTYESI